MTPEQQRSIFDLVVQDDGKRGITPAAFLAEFGADDGVALGQDLLQDAYDRRDRDDVESSLTVGSVFGVAADSLDVLIALAFADWHYQHENVIIALQKIGSPSATDALKHLAEWLPPYDDADDYRTLASNAIWALGRLLPSAAAEAALQELTRSESDIVAKGAIAQLQR